MSALLVPIMLDVLVLRQNTAAEDWALTEMEMPNPPSKGRRRQKLLPDPFQTLPRPRSKGAYLHWALPDGLTRGRSAGTGVKFPAVPDRWLIIRLSGPANPTRAMEAWLIPSASAQTSVVLGGLFNNPPIPPGMLTGEPITALGHGDFAWAAYYDNVKNRFALYDDLAGVASGPLAYLVCGWYSDPALDPIVAGSQSEFNDRLKNLLWELKTPLQASQDYPTQSLYHAAALAIGWPEQSWPGDGGILSRELDLRPAANKVDLAVGETLAESIAALLNPIPTPGIVRLLEGTISHALTRLSSLDDEVHLDATLHTDRFGSTPVESREEYIWQPAEVSRSDGSAGSFIRAGRATPRLFHGMEPVLVIRGAGRSPKHGGDGRYSDNGHLICRLDNETMTAFGVKRGNLGRGAEVLPANPLAGLRPEYKIPAGVESLLVELACLDPGSAPDLTTATPSTLSPVAEARSRYWKTFDPAVTPESVLAGTYREGILPSPVGVTPPMRPWNPLHLEWQASYLPSPNGMHDWPLGEIDFDLPKDIPDPLPEATHQPWGRSLLTAAPAKLLDEAVRRSGNTTDLSKQDLLSAALDGLIAQLRGDSQDAVVSKMGSPGNNTMPQGPRPETFVALRAGFLSIDRLRLVDSFGQYIDLVGGNVANPTKMTLGDSLQIPRHEGLLAQRPRFTAPARLLLRLTDATGTQLDASASVSPLCGYIVPSLLDGTMEFFDSDGLGYGRLRPDLARVTAWEEDPGQPATLGTSPAKFLPNRFLGAIAEGILAADTSLALARANEQPIPRSSALSALLRVLDQTRWTVDPTGRSGDEHLTLLLGQPIAVVRATIKMDIADRRRPPENTTTAVAVRLGSLAQRGDGLLAYFVGDIFDRVYTIDPAISELASGSGITSSSFDSPYINSNGMFYINPGVPVTLTLLMTPGGDVCATTGLLPQKRIGMMREWTNPGLSRLAPTLQFGPVLRDLSATRLPVSPNIRGIWRWHRRIDLHTWTTDVVIPATADALLSEDLPQASEGWLQIELHPDTEYFDTAIPLQIKCIRSRDACGERQIIAVGGFNADGSPFLLPLQQAIQLQESGRFSFYMEEPAGHKVWARVMRTPQGAKDLQASTDMTQPNNLLMLPECSFGGSISPLSLRAIAIAAGIHPPLSVLLDIMNVACDGDRTSLKDHLYCLMSGTAC